MRRDDSRSCRAIKISTQILFVLVEAIFCFELLIFCAAQTQRHTPACRICPDNAFCKPVSTTVLIPTIPTVCLSLTITVEEPSQHQMWFLKAAPGPEPGSRAAWQESGLTPASGHTGAKINSHIVSLIRL